MKPIIIVTTPRTGSTVVCEILGNLLIQHNGCKNVLYEYFDVSTAFKCEYENVNNILYIKDYIRFSGNVKWYKSQLEHVTGQIVKLNGEYNYLMKYMPSVTQYGVAEIIDTFIMENYDIVYLERKDKLRQLISYLGVTQRSVPHYTNKSDFPFYSKDKTVDRKIIYNHLESELFIKNYQKYKQFKNTHISKYPVIYYEDFLQRGANDKALIDILQLPIDTYKPTDVTTIITPYVESNLEDQILNRVDWDKDKERILNDLQ
jgi:hypothetical protein